MRNMAKFGPVGEWIQKKGLANQGWRLERGCTSSPGHPVASVLSTNLLENAGRSFAHPPQFIGQWWKIYFRKILSWMWRIWTRDNGPNYWVVIADCVSRLGLGYHQKNKATTCRCLSFKRFLAPVFHQGKGNATLWCTVCEIKDQHWYIMALEGHILSPGVSFRLNNVVVSTRSSHPRYRTYKRDDRY